MKIISLVYLIIFFYLDSICISQSFGQSNNEVTNQLDNILNSYQGGMFERQGAIINVDSSIGNQGIANGLINDPYGTLKNCYLFVASTKTINKMYLFGIFKDSQILWRSDPLTGSENYGLIGDEGFIATKDLNNQGKLDILISFSNNSNPPSMEFLWIYSWDGLNGLCINQILNDGSTNLMSACSFDLFDVNGDGIDEILACTSTDSVNLAYSWNGNLYGHWVGSPNLKDKKFTVANNLMAKVNADVNKDGNFLRYSYSIINSSNSIQKIASFYVQINVDSLISYRFPSGWNGGIWINHKLFNCFAGNENDLIKPSFWLDSIDYSSTGLPNISLYILNPFS